MVNRSFEEQNFINKLKRRKIELHARSCFLQGVLLNKPKTKKIFFKNNLEAYFKWIQKETLTPFEACLNFVYKNKDIDKFVLGFDNLKKIKNIKNINLKKNIISLKNLLLKIKRF